MKYAFLSLFIMLSLQSYAQELNQKVAQNAVNCFVGHKFAGSYEPKIANRYLAASYVLLGADATNKLVEQVSDRAEIEKSKFKSTDKEVGILLVYDYCPQIHELTKPGTPLGIKIDDFAKQFNSRNKSEQ